MFQPTSARRAAKRKRWPAIAAPPAAGSRSAFRQATFVPVCASACALAAFSAGAATDNSVARVQHVLASTPANAEYLPLNMRAGIDYAAAAEVVKPALRDPTLYAKARCNDGTPFTFFIDKGYEGGQQSRKWVIYLDGGLFCEDDAYLCSERAQDLTTTAPMDDGLRFAWPMHGILSNDTALNPDFYKANRVFAGYCSSDLWAGSSNARRPSSGDPVNGWYFSGRTNINAMLDVLMSSFGLTDGSNTNVIWAGGSAGSFGAQLTANQAAKHLPKTFAGGRLRLLKDAGWMPDWDNPDHRMGSSTQADREMYRDAFAFWGATVDPRCKAAVADPMDCVIAPMWYDQYKSQGWPIFIQSSATDSAYMTAHGFSDATPPADVDAWLAAVQSSMTDVDWLFSSSDATHTILAEDGGWGSGPSGSTLREVVGRFAHDGPAERVTFGERWVSCDCEPLSNWWVAGIPSSTFDQPLGGVVGETCEFSEITAKRSVAAEHATPVRDLDYCGGLDPEVIQHRG